MDCLLEFRAESDVRIQEIQEEAEEEGRCLAFPRRGMTSPTVVE